MLAATETHAAVPRLVQSLHESCPARDSTDTMHNTAAFMRRTWRTKTSAMRKQRSTASFNFDLSDEEEEEEEERQAESPSNAKEDPMTSFGDLSSSDDLKRNDSVYINDRRLSQYDATHEHEEAAPPPTVRRTSSRPVHNGAATHIPLPSNRGNYRLDEEQTAAPDIYYHDRQNNVRLMICNPEYGQITAQLCYVDRDGTQHDICLQGKPR